MTPQVNIAGKVCVCVCELQLVCTKHAFGSAPDADSSCPWRHVPERSENAIDMSQLLWQSAEACGLITKARKQTKTKFNQTFLITGTAFCGVFFLFIFFFSFSLLLFSTLSQSSKTQCSSKAFYGIYYLQYVFIAGEWCVLFSSFSLCVSTAQRPLSRLYLQAACSCWLASSCAQAEFSPTIPIMKIKTCGRGPDRYCSCTLLSDMHRGADTTGGVAE